MHRCIRPLLATCFALALGSALGTPVANAGYTPVTPLGGSGALTSEPVAAAAADGSAAIAYRQNDQVYAAIKAPGQLFGAAVPVGAGRAPRLAMAPGGRAILSWISADDQARIAFRAPGASSFTEVAPLASGDVYGVAVAMNADGRAYAGAQLTNGALMSSYAPNSSERSALPTGEILPAAGGMPTSIAIALQSGTEIAWLLVTSRHATGSEVTAQRWSASLGPGPQFTVASEADVISVPPAPTDSPVTFGDAAGVAGVQPSFYWTRYQSNSTQANSRKIRVDGPLSAPTTMVFQFATNSLGNLYPQSSTPSAVVSPSGSALIGWVDSLGSLGDSPTIRVARRTSAGAWSSAPGIAGLTSPFGAPRISQFALAPGANGTAQALYPVDSGRVITAPLSSDAVLTAPEPTLLHTAPAGTRVGQVAASGPGNGDTALAWVETSTGTGQGAVQVALGDVTPPTVAIAPPSAFPMIPAEGIRFTSAEEVSAFNQRDRNVTLEAVAQDTWTPTTITWDFGDGTTATGPTVTHQFDPARASAQITVTARDLAGNTTTAIATRDFLTATLATPPKGPPTLQTEVALSGLKLNRTRFAVNRPGKPSTRKAKKGATVSFKLTAPTRVEFGVTTKARGYRSSDGKTCTPKKPKDVKKPKRCTFDRQLGLAGITEGVPGPNTFALSGKVAGKSLKPGKYALTVGIYPRLQSHASLAATAKFTIVK